jgi:hypothetical protein
MRITLLLIVALAAAPVVAKPRRQPTEPPEKISALVVYGNDPCPQSTEGEVVVCARQPESERYRIPKALRQPAYNAARDGSWIGTAQVLESVSRKGLPGSCSPVGSNGQTGCFAQFLAENRR